MNDKNFNEVIEKLPDRLNNILEYIPSSVKSDTYEIRLRKNKPLMLFGKFGSLFVLDNSTLTSIEWKHSAIVTEDEIRNTVTSICNYSVYANQNQIADGFVTFGAGNRAGFGGTAVMSGSRITTLRDISSLNLRIARSHIGCADKLLSSVCTGNDVQSFIIAGAPCTGKTTLLKDIARQLSSNYKYGYKKTAIVDERFEMSGIDGINLDVLEGYPKDVGIVHALRVLSPEIIICDEVSTEEEADKIVKGVNSGVKFIVSVHATDIKDLYSRKIAKILMESGEFSYNILLSSAKNPGTISKIVKIGDEQDENCSSCDSVDMFPVIVGDNYEHCFKAYKQS